MFISQKIATSQNFKILSEQKTIFRKMIKIFATTSLTASFLFP